MNWFKNAICYRFEPADDFTEERLEKTLQEKPFVPCGRHEVSRSGWTSPTGPLSDSPVFSSNGYILISYLVEEKILPSSVIRDEMDERIRVIEENEARKVYRKERQQMKDDITLELLPRAFTRRHRTRALLMPQQGWILVDVGSFKRAEDLLSALREALGSLIVRPLEVNQAPSSVMTEWLQDKRPIPSVIEVEDESELRDLSAEGGVIRVKGQDLFSDEIRAHLDSGMQITRLAFNWEEQIRLVLHADMSLHRLKLTDQFREQMDNDSPEDELAYFDAQLTQMGLEFSRFVPALVDAFGGEPVR